MRAADFFAAARKPRAEWKKLDDLSAQLAEFDLRCAAGDYDTAASVLTEIDFEYLLLWGHYHLTIDLLLRIKDKITDTILRISNLNSLGSAYHSISNIKVSIGFCQQGLETSREEKHRGWENAFLGNLGRAYAKLGEFQKAVDFLEQALDISREIGSRPSEERNLGSIAIIKFNLGYSQEAIEYLEKALVISREIGDKADEFRYYGNIGEALIDLGKYDEAINHHKQAQVLAKEIEYAGVLKYNIMGEALAYLFKNDFVNARFTIEIALQYDEPEDNHYATALHGIIALRQGEEVTARGAFVRAIGQADEILSKTAEYYEALDAKGIALSGLVVSGKWEVDSERQKALDEAVETFRKARKIAPHAGVVKSVLRLFDELVKCEGGEILKDVRKAVEGSDVQT